MYTNILHATDLGHNHFELSKKAAEIANIFHATLHLIFILETPTSLQIAQGLGFAEFDRPVKDEAQAVIATLGEALGVPPEQQYIEIGSAKHQILSKALEINSDLIIIGSHTPSSLPAILGSTAHAVTHQSSCDVLTLKAK